MVKNKDVRRLIYLALVIFLSFTAACSKGDEVKRKENKAMMNTEGHFTIISSAKRPSPGEIANYLEKTWSTFYELFEVKPAAVRVIISLASGPAAFSQADQESSTANVPPPTASQGTPREHQMAWAISEGNDLSNQTFSDLSHEVAHLYFLDYMEEKGGFHQSHAWLHEAVAIHHESELFRQGRLRWIREHINDRIPLDQLFSMKNPVKLNPLVELTTQLHEKLARGEISVPEVNRQVSEYAQAHAAELAHAGARNMTYYSESFSVFMFLLESEGKEFIRNLCQGLKNGKTVEEMIRNLPTYPKGIIDLERAWVAWIQRKTTR